MPLNLETAHGSLHCEGAQKHPPDLDPPRKVSILARGHMGVCAISSRFVVPLGRPPTPVRNGVLRTPYQKTNVDRTRLKNKITKN